MAKVDKKKVIKKAKESRTAHAITGAVSTAAIPATMGVFDWRILAGTAAAGAVAGFFGVDLAGVVKKKMAKK